MARKEPPLKVEIPKAGDDRPAWSKVGIIGVAGFVIGMAWPRLAGIHLGPNVPSDAHPAAEAAGPLESLGGSGGLRRAVRRSRRERSDTRRLRRGRASRREPRARRRGLGQDLEVLRRQGQEGRRLRRAAVRIPSPSRR